jgi:S-adenosylmethionine decarboxylase
VKAIGRHIILEMWGCQNLDSVDVAERALREMVTALDVNLLDLKIYPFSPIGVTGMAIVSESHLVIHTWPEYGYAAVDVFTCGAPRDPEAAVAVLRRLFSPERIGVMEINRGQLDLPDQELASPPESRQSASPSPSNLTASRRPRPTRAPAAALSA